MPKVSVIIPVYGVEKYIERCAISLFEQTLDDIEYIFINDCTKDRSIEILNEVINRYPTRKEQTRIEKMPINSGLPAVREYGIKLATGDYIIHCDSDDWVTFDAYEKMYKKAIYTKYDMVFCNFYYTNGIHHTSSIICKLDNMPKEYYLYLLVRHIRWSVCSVMVKREILYNNNIVYPRENNFEDLVLMVQMLCHASSFGCIQEPLYYYYNNNSSSITKSKNEEHYLKRQEQACKNTNIAIDFILKYNLRNASNIILILKLYCRSILSPLTFYEDFRNKWYLVYPELDNEKIFLNRTIPLNLKLNYYSVKTRTFFIAKKIQVLIKHLLNK